MSAPRTSVVLALAALAPTAAADDLSVPGDFTTIQDAIDDAAPGDRILVGPGTWNEAIDFLGKDLRVLSTDGPEATVIDGGGASVVVRFSATNGPETELRGFTVTGGGTGISVSSFFGATGGRPHLLDLIVAGNTGRGFFGWGCSSVIDDCVFADNGGSGLEFMWEGGDALLRNCLVRGNQAAFFGSGIYADESAVVRALNCTIVENSGVPGVYTTFDAHAELINCIVRDNTAPQIATGIGSLDVTYCDVQGGFEGEGNFDEDALFVDAAGGDYRLKHDSPCVDAGTDGVVLPLFDYFGDFRIGGDTVDLGFDEHYTLQGDHPALSLSGDVLTMRLDGGTAVADEIYLVLGSLTGTSPATPFPGAELPLVVDGYFWFTAQHPNQGPLGNTLGLLDGAGAAESTLTLPAIDAPALIGTDLWHAYLRFDQGLVITGASDALQSRFVD